MCRFVSIGTVVAAVVVALSGAYAFAQEFSAHLSGFQEIPAILSNGRGTFNLELHENAGTATYRLTYSGLRSPPTAANIHFGAMRVAGGVMTVLCGGSGKPACPVNAGSTAPVTGTITSADIQAIAPQGVMAGDFGAFRDALSSNIAYINIHTLDFPDGELRGQIHGGGLFNYMNSKDCWNVMNSFNNSFNNASSIRTPDSDNRVCVERK
jgi:CHRD domain